MKAITLRNGAYACPYCDDRWEGEPKREDVINFAASSKEILTFQEAIDQGYLFHRIRCQNGHSSFVSWSQDGWGNFKVWPKAWKCGHCGRIWGQVERAIRCCAKEVLAQQAEKVSSKS